MPKGKHTILKRRNIMKEKELHEYCQNIFNINARKQNENSRPLTLEDIDTMTLIAEDIGFDIQNYEGDLENTHIYYIQKYKKVLTFPQAVEFINQHKEENFLLVDNSYASKTDIWFYMINEPNNLTLYCFHAVGGGHMTLFAVLRNVPGKAEWQKPEIVSDTCFKIEHNEREYEKNKFTFAFARDGWSSYSEGRPINFLTNNCWMDTHEVLERYLFLPGKSRITFKPYSVNYKRFFGYVIGKEPEKDDLPIVKRYGIPVFNNGCNYKYGDKYMYNVSDRLESEITQEDWDRVSRRLTSKLDAMEQNSDPQFTNRKGEEPLHASMILITEPVEGHRRPTFHLIRAFRNNDITEIVELSRGELSIKNMFPEEVYCLFNNGMYCHASYNIKGDMRDLINDPDTEVDPVTYNKWAEERSLHPELLKLLSESYFKTIELDKVRLLNKLPFGALLIDQLITSGYAELAINLAAHITEKAYDTHHFCSQLSDLFPGCNGEETSLYKILNISRNTAKFLFEGINPTEISLFIAKFKAIHYYGGNSVLTDEIIQKVENYLILFSAGQATMKLGFGDRQFDFIEYPNLIKQVLKMERKIIDLKNVTSQQKNQILTQYKEIVRAYVSFLDYQKIAPEEEKKQWDPATQRIFLEFSLTGTPERPLDPVTELELREKHANRALAIYKNKADEEVTKLNEEKYAYRKRHAIDKLRSLASLSKTNACFAGYVVLVPTQVYGIDVVGSIEKEGCDQNHCLFRQYTNEIVEGHFTPLWLRLEDKPEESLVTFSLTMDGRIDQTRGEGDRDITVQEAKAIAAWAMSKYGMVTFRSEGKDVAPGGWPSNVAVPSLPTPDRDWLYRLSQTHALKTY